ncbi:molybdate ABC transporter substrate-binding protein, partial [Acinetobacter baumannii]|nr:molybdate ABC transporter substrate-binding protein [Acinetobacter baumannii]
MIKKTSNSEKFYKFLQSNQAKAVFKKYGFSVLAPVKP